MDERIEIKTRGKARKNIVHQRYAYIDYPDLVSYKCQALALILEQIAPQIYREGDFIADFLQINDAGLTFADYAGLDNYFRRQAARSAGLSQATVKLVRGAMDLIFGFLPAELKQWIDSAIAKDTLCALSAFDVRSFIHSADRQVVGMLVCLERFLADADERDSAFFMQMLEKHHARLKGFFDRHVVGRWLCWSIADTHDNF